MTITIDKNIPIPQKAGGIGKLNSFPWNELEVGDSFLLTNTKPKSAHVATARANARFKPKRFTSRVVEGGVRIWRCE